MAALHSSVSHVVEIFKLCNRASALIYVSFQFFFREILDDGNYDGEGQDQDQCQDQDEGAWKGVVGGWGKNMILGILVILLTLILVILTYVIILTEY